MAATTKNVYLKNVAGQTLYPYTTNVPHKAQFSFADGQLALDFDKVRDGLGLSSDSLSFSLPYQTFSQVTDNQVTLSGLPVGIKTDLGNYYPVQKNSLQFTQAGITLTVTRYLAYDGLDTFSGTWTAYFACGRDGQQGPQGQSGAAGPANTLSIGTVSSGDTASATVTGDSPNQTLNLVLPKGDKGDTGADGAQGADGITPHIDNTTKHWFIGDTDTGILAQADLGEARKQITSVDAQFRASLQSALAPVAVLTDLGNYYPIQKNSVTVQGNTYTIQLARYLAYDGVDTFTGPWTVYFAGGGQTGQQGIQGEQGQAGPANVLSVGTVTSGAAASATITGTSPSQVLNLVLPKGDKGDKGDTGQPGAAGASAYQVWVNNGNAGTQTDFLNSLKATGYRHPFTAADISNDTLTITTTGTPVSISDQASVTYPLQFASYRVTGTQVTIDMAVNLSAIGKPVSGTWYVNFAAGGPGAQPSGTYVTQQTEASFTPAANNFYKHTIAQGQSITFDSTNMSAGRCSTFELWLVMGGTVVSFSLPDNLTWVGAAPSFDSANTLYALVIRWDGQSYIANLAYTKTVA